MRSDDIHRTYFSGESLPLAVRPAIGVQRGVAAAAFVLAGCDGGC